MDLSFDRASDSERDQLGRLRAGAWAGKASPDQFVGRNRRLYEHEFGKKRIQTLVLRARNKQIISSMDILTIPMLVQTIPQQPPQQVEGFLIASVITPQELRGRGYAGTLLRHFFAENKKIAGILYSDIGPEYYEQFGFHENLCWAVVGEARKTEFRSAVEPLKLGPYTEKLLEIRTRALQKMAPGAGCVAPDAVFLDWQIDRYRYFAGLADCVWNDEVFFEIKHQGENNATHLALMVPHHFYQQAEVLWHQPGCAECLEFLSFQAAAWGYSKFHYWDSSPSQNAMKQECPMIRIEGVSAGHFLDPQLCDWW